MTATRFESALERNLAELQKALLIRETLVAIEKHRYTAKVFTQVIYDALENDYISHAIKVLDRNGQSSSFWYIYRSDAGPIDRHLRATGYTIEQLQTVSAKLKVVRDGTHFHIDSRGVLDPEAIWRVAGLTGKELAAALDFVWGALSIIQTARGGDVPSLFDYTSADALVALQRVEGTDS